MQVSKDHVSLTLLGDGSGRPFIGVRAVPGRLPQLLRYPGESAQAFSARALHHVTGNGSMWAQLMYRDDSAPSPLSGPSAEVKDTGRNEREIAAVCSRPKTKRY